MSEKFEFLSPEWEKAADEIVGDREVDNPTDVQLTINITVTPTPYGDKQVSIVARENSVALIESHQETSDVTVKSDYDTAKALFLEGTMAIVMNAMMQGKVVVQGNMAKLMSMASNPGASGAMPFLEDISTKLKEITL
ncbi:MAG: SCP2 sterol-binding domain-containing protein [Acidimicrobiia bacterium]|nr:SCP2 sterol-binding domain-containing protein [Acidimicrobiia bacterium]